MGDPRRFDEFAALIERTFPNRDAVIADVAGGKGYLQAALRQRGYRNITSWDKRHKYAANRRGYRYGWFTAKDAPAGYELVLGMHPDEGTDECIVYAAKHRVPFAICPCCIKPSAATFWGTHDSRGWFEHLRLLAAGSGFAVREAQLPIVGRSKVLIGEFPEASPIPIESGAESAHSGKQNTADKSELLPTQLPKEK